MEPVNAPVKFEVGRFTRSWDNRGTLKLWEVPWYTPFKVIQGLWFWYQSKAY